MVNPDPLAITVPAGHFWHGQVRHLLLLVALLPGAVALASPVLDGTVWFGLSDWTWFWLGLLVPIAQQLFVALLWRAQLSNSLLTNLFGEAGFTVWGVIFFPLLVARPLGILAIGLSDVGSLRLSGLIAWPVGASLVLVAAYGMHSVKKYFGFARALGGDHFFERYRNLPMVREGVFRWSSNAMYSVIFLGLWGIALLTRSQAALAIALFQHAYIWVHWYCTEQPDGVVLYGRSQDED